MFSDDLSIITNTPFPTEPMESGKIALSNSDLQRDNLPTSCPLLARRRIAWNRRAGPLSGANRTCVSGCSIAGCDRGSHLPTCGRTESNAVVAPVHHQGDGIRFDWTERMNLVRGILVAALLLGGMRTGDAAERISYDRGGRIGDYVDKYRHLRDTGEFVIIDGLCAGACALVLGAIPGDRICVTSNAIFGFKAANDPGPDGRFIPNLQATRMLYEGYPAAVRRWIAQQGGLTTHMIFLRGRELQALYRSCSIDIHASGSRPRMARIEIGPRSCTDQLGRCISYSRTRRPIGSDQICTNVFNACMRSGVWDATRAFFNGGVRITGMIRQ